ncbi:MAG: IPT/TIG domain-containing protein [Chloroflexi bacterium]|nr:IPT/TIG domain-containing protein [Chloroflexota bacterium]
MERFLSRLAVLILILGLTVYGPNPGLAQAAATLTLSQTSGTPGSTLSISGSNFTASETGINVTYDGSPVATGIVANAVGAWTTSFTVPASASGSHPIVATGPVTGAVSTTFTVVAGISMSPLSGAPGTTVTVTGAGFGASETGVTVTYDGVAVVPAGVPVTAQGGWTATFPIPASASGAHSIQAFGSTTSTPRTIIFSVTPTVTLNRSSGAPGSSVTVTGSGFGASETGITVTYDGIIVASSISANSQGFWSTSIVIPSSPAGSHAIHAYGATTIAAATSDATFVVGAGISVNQASGAPGSSLTVTGSGFGISETGISITYDAATVASGIRANDKGNWTATFTVPASPAGSHSIRAAGSTTPAVSDVVFTVTPAIASGQTGGAPGSPITVTGSGFAANETGITVTYDNATVASGIRANAQGNWTATFTIPASPAGSHVIHAAGGTTQAASIPDVILTVGAGISVSQTSGAPGRSLTVTGSGFAANETGITVTYDTATVASGIRANAQGTWNATFVIPSSASGSHSIRASGATTQAASTSEVIFTVAPGLAVSQASGAPGNSLTVTGSGFAANETGITVTYDTTTVASGIRANAQGNWTATFVVPPSASGSHSIRASGAMTQAGAVSEASFTASAGIALNPASGHVGGAVEITGSGFAPNSALRFTYDDSEIPAAGVTTDATGSFSKSVTIPQSKAGPHTIRVTDAQRVDARATFTMDSTAPPAPAPSSPDDGARIGVLGGGKPTLRWSNVTDPSGVTYILQIDTTAEFSLPVVEKVELKTNQYTLTASEALPLGEYFWRVRAVDGASNQSAWSPPRVLKSGLMPLWALLAIILGGVGLAVFGAYYLIVKLSARRRQAIAVAEGEVPRVVVTGQWRSIEAEETAREPRPLPLRLALPQPEKGKKTLSYEDQARLKVIVDFAQSLPLAEAGYTTSWLTDLIETGMGISLSAPVYEQLLRSELQVRYEPTWINHPTYQDLTSLLEGQAILQDLNSFVDAVNRCASEATLLLQDIYRDSTSEIPSGFLEKGGWNYISAVYADAMSWFLGRSLRDPSERDYSIKPRGGDEAGGLWLFGEDTTAFAGPLIQAADEKEGIRFRTLHLKLRRSYRNNNKAKDLVGMMTQLEVQRSKLLNIFSQFGRLRQ